MSVGAFTAESLPRARLRQLGKGILDESAALSMVISAGKVFRQRPCRATGFSLWR